MKKSESGFLLIIFTISIIIFGLIFSNKSFAQESAPQSAVASKSANINYDLPYPGLLPDHPLYFLKAARDRIVSFFMSSPIKKSEYDLLQADKRIAASQILVSKKNIDLAQSTFSKAENYFEQALTQAQYAKMQGLHTGEIGNKLQEANQKHQQVLDDMMDKMEQNDKNKFMIERKRLNGFEQKAKELLPKE